MTVRQSADDVMQEAARWVLRLDREDRTPEIEREITEWIAGDPRRPGALLQAETTWHMLDIAGTSGDLGSENVDDDDGERQSALSGGKSRRYFLGALGAGIAASLAGLVAVLPRETAFDTAVGEVRRVPLVDRSAVAINTDSRIRVAYADDRRAVSIDRGEAWFHVAKDKARPFVVSAGPVRVEAVGTAFSVRRRATGADVLVTEGVVRVWVEGAEADAIHIGAGSMAFVSDETTVPPRAEVAPPEIERKLAWRSGQLDLAGETLADAVAEFNRYSAVAIVVDDPRIAAKRLYGTFRLDDPEGFARTAAVTLGTSASGQGDRIVIAEQRNR